MYRNVEIFSLGLDDFVIRSLDALMFGEEICNPFNPSTIHITLIYFNLPNNQVKQIEQ